MVHQLDRLVEYYWAQKGKGKGKMKRNSPQQLESKEGEIQASPQHGEENIQEPKNVEVEQSPKDPEVPAATQGQEEIEIEVQEVFSP